MKRLPTNFLNQWRILYAHNLNTKYDFAKEFLEEKILAVGTPRTKKKSVPKKILRAKIKRGKMVSCKDANKNVILKLRNTRDVQLLSTLHKPEMIEVCRRTRPDEGTSGPTEEHSNSDESLTSNAPAKGALTEKQN